VSDPLAMLGALDLCDGDLRLEFSKFAQHPYHKAPTYYLRMTSIASGAEVGTINLRVGSTAHIERYAGHIGYGVHVEFRGHRYAARSVRLLVPLARRLGLNPPWITCDPENHASRRSLELAGAEFIEIVDIPLDCGMRKFGGKTRKCRYRL
jgi:tagatose 1,6-diphosphate aldolase